MPSTLTEHQNKKLPGEGVVKPFIKLSKALPTPRDTFSHKSLTYKRTQTSSSSLNLEPEKENLTALKNEIFISTYYNYFYHQ